MYYLISGLIILLTLAVVFYAIVQAYNGLIKREVGYALGSLLGLLIGGGLEFLLDRFLLDSNDNVLEWGPVLGFWLGSYIIPLRLYARGIFAIIIGIGWVLVLLWVINTLRTLIFS